MGAVLKDKLPLSIFFSCNKSYYTHKREREMSRTLRFVTASLYILVAVYGCYSAWAHGTRFFLYFTNLGNLYCLGLMINEWVRLIRRKPLSMALMQWEFGGLITILAIGAIYNLILGDPTSAAYWHNKPNVCLHLITPILYTLYFVATRPMRKVTAGGIQCGVLIPYLYIAFIYTRHLITGDQWFPYFFLDINLIGWLGALCWILALTVIFVMTGIIFIYLGKKRARK